MRSRINDCERRRGVVAVVVGLVYWFMSPAFPIRKRRVRPSFARTRPAATARRGP